VKYGITIDSDNCSLVAVRGQSRSELEEMRKKKTFRR
jgi:hypothetical protein